MSVWDEARLGGAVGGRHALGLWHPQHKLASLAFMPPLSERRKIYRKQRFALVFNFTVGGSNPNSAVDRVSLTSDFWWTDTIVSLPGTYYTTGMNSLSLYDTKNGVRYSNIAEMDLSFAGLSNQTLVPGGDVRLINNIPFLHRRITKIPAGAILVGKLQVTYTNPNTAQTEQLVLGGYTD